MTTDRPLDECRTQGRDDPAARDADGQPLPRAYVAKSQESLSFPDGEGQNRGPSTFARPWHAARRDVLKFHHPAPYELCPGGAVRRDVSRT